MPCLDCRPTSTRAEEPSWSRCPQRAQCQWSVYGYKTETEWVSHASNLTRERTGPGAAALVAGPNPGGARSQALVIAGTPVMVTQAAGSATPDPCTYRIFSTAPPASSPASGYSVPPSAGTLAATMETGPTCRWVIGVNKPWIRVTPLSGTGPTALSIAFDANSDDRIRSGYVYVYGTYAASVAQAVPGGVEIVTHPTGRSIGPGQVAPMLSRPPSEPPLEYDWEEGWDWIRQNDYDTYETLTYWRPLQAGGYGYSGERSSTLTVAFDRGSVDGPTSRKYRVRVRNSLASVTSREAVVDFVAPVNCGFGVAPGEVISPLDGNAVPLQVNVESGCRWDITGLQPWITPSQTSGDRTATITLTVAANRGGAPRRRSCAWAALRR